MRLIARLTETLIGFVLFAAIPITLVGLLISVVVACTSSTGTTSHDVSQSMFFYEDTQRGNVCYVYQPYAETVAMSCLSKPQPITSNIPTLPPPT